MYESVREFTLEEIESIAKEVAVGERDMHDLVGANIKNVLHLTARYATESFYEDIVQDALLAIATCDIRKAKKPTVYLASLILDSARRTFNKISGCVTHTHYVKSYTEEYDSIPIRGEIECTTPNFESVDIQELSEKIGFTELEDQILKYSMLGYTQQEIADKLELTWRVVQHSLAHIIPTKAKAFFNGDIS